MSSLAVRQAALVRALVLGGDVPEGVDPRRLRVAENSLLRKRSGEVARHLPMVVGQLGTDRFTAEFMGWARGRVRGGSAADAHAFVEHLVSTGVYDPPEPPRRLRPLLRRRRA